MADKVYIKNLDLEIDFKNEETLLEVLLKNEIDIDHSCGGMGTCGTCRAFVCSSLEDLPPRNEVESERATDLSFNASERLCCQLKPYDGLAIDLPEHNITSVKI